MLPLSHQQVYQRLLKSALQLQVLAVDGSAGTEFEREWQVLEQSVGQLLALPQEALKADKSFFPYSLHTEIYRAWRLLKTEKLFWQSARQGTTAQQRLRAISVRLGQLIDYCQALLT
ncbi:MAG: heterocyst frequency control protein PatD [Chloroflexaceae bacterium]|nr:heterocyst frequency control protein PatD [Chloroflexaceae bacterium]